MSGESGMDGVGIDKTQPKPTSEITTSKSDQEPVSQKENLPKPHFKFIFGGHATKENAERVLEGVKNCQIIAQELVGADEEGREYERSFWQELADEEEDSPRSLEILELFQDSIDRGREGAEYDYYLAKGLNGTGKTMLFIDMPENDPHFYLINEFEPAYQRYADALKEKQGLSTILSTLRQSINATTDMNIQREELVTKQLRELGKILEGRGDLNIGVVEGSVHSGISHQMRAADYPTSREFENIEGEREKGIGNRMYSWYEDAVRKQTLLPDKPLPDNFLKRIIISNLFSESGVTDDEARRMDKDLERMTEEEVDAKLSELLANSPPQP